MYFETICANDSLYGFKMILQLSSLTKHNPEKMSND